jgi:hypothetical protein
MDESIRDLVDRLWMDTDDAVELPPPVFAFRGVPAPAFHEVENQPSVDINEKKESKPKRRPLSETRIGGSSPASGKSMFKGSSFVGDFLDQYLTQEREKEASRNADSLYFVNLALGSSMQASEIYADLKRYKDESVRVYGYFRSSLELGVSARTEEDVATKVSDALNACGYLRSSYYFHKIQKIS